MGWDWYPEFSNLSDLRKYILQQVFRSQEVLDSYSKGKSFWVLARSGEQPSIYLFMLEKNKEGCGYKAIHEDSGPYDYSCPLSFVERSPEEGRTEFSLSWRKRLLAQSERQNQVFQAGDLVSVFGNEYKIVSKIGRHHWMISDGQKVYKAKSGDIHLLKKGSPLDSICLA
jgi:hypothetical protein